jgi:death on curing protein
MPVEFLLLEAVVAHLTRKGFVVKDLGLLDSALSRPKSTLFGQDAYESLELKAAAMMHSIIKNHPMIDGNKRSAWFCTKSFLAINGRLVEAEPELALEFILDVATDRIDLPQIAEWLFTHSRLL